MMKIKDLRAMSSDELEAKLLEKKKEVQTAAEQKNSHEEVRK